MAGGVINTGTHPKLLWPGIQATWGQVYNSHAKQYDQLYDWSDSKKAYEQTVQVTGFGLAPVKAQGAPIAYDSEFQGLVPTFTHTAYALGYKVTYEELQDNLYKEVSTRRAKANAFSINQTVETVAAFVYNNANTTTYFSTADGVALGSASHVQVSGGTFSNILSPAADLSEAALENLTIQVMNATNDTGLRISLMPESLHIATNELYNANRILESVLQSDTANNNINVLKATNVFPKGIKMNNYLTNGNWFFIRTNCPEGMTGFWRNHPEFSQDNDFNTKNALAATYMRFSVGCSDPRGIYIAFAP
jgi:hypothetical protein